LGAGAETRVTSEREFEVVLKPIFFTPRRVQSQLADAV
jgi:hypothetical protein